MARLILKRGRAKPLWHGHPWVYAQAVGSVEGTYAAGDVVDVVDHQGAFIGRGHAHPGSSIIARILTNDSDERVDLALLRRRLEAAIALRRRLGLPSEQTDCYRLVNSEGDLLPGLIVDVYGEAAAVQFTTLGMFRLADAIHDLLAELLQVRQLVELGASSLAQAEGVTSDTRTIRGTAGPATCREHGLVYRVELERGQKTGLYLDQRENHALVGQLAGGARVLDLYSYAGGFALHAARGGARQVTAVDASGRALSWARENAALNDLTVELVEQDAFRYAAEAAAEHYDLVIVDPPKFARSRRELAAALKGYRKLHRLVLRLLRPGGILCTACCSQLVPTDEWLRSIAAASMEQRRRLRLLRLLGAGPDHPTLPGFPEGDYLRFAVCQVSS